MRDVDRDRRRARALVLDVEDLEIRRDEREVVRVAARRVRDALDIRGLEIGINDGCGSFVEVNVYAAPTAFVWSQIATYS